MDQMEWLFPWSPIYQLGAQIFHLNENATVNSGPFPKGAPLSGLQIGEINFQKAEVHENAKFSIPYLKNYGTSFD